MAPRRASVRRAATGDARHAGSAPPSSADRLACRDPPSPFATSTRHFGAVRAVDGVDLDIARRRVLRHARPVGLGQDHLPAPDRRLRAADRRPDRDLRRGRSRACRPIDRDVNTVFQDYALFPHMTVLENVAYGLMIRGVAAAERRRRGRDDARAGAARPAWRRAGRRSSPAASASASRSPARWSTSRRCCCSTSRSARSTSSCARRCRAS